MESRDNTPAGLEGEKAQRVWDIYTFLSFRMNHFSNPSGTGCPLT